MENASKALIIAGAILISIILISIGIMVINNAQIVIDQSGKALDRQAIETFNAPYVTYAGRQRGSTIKTLAQSIIANNATDPDNKIVVKYLNSEIEPSQVLTTISPTKYYTVNFQFAGEKDVNPGIVREMDITEYSGNSSSWGGQTGNTI